MRKHRREAVMTYLTPGAPALYGRSSVSCPLAEPTRQFVARKFSRLPLIKPQLRVLEGGAPAVINEQTAARMLAGSGVVMLDGATLDMEALSALVGGTVEEDTP